MDRIKRGLPNLLSLLGLMAVFTLFAILGGARFTSSRNYTLILNQSYTVIIAAIGVTMLYAHGGIDFSVGAVLGLSEMLAAMAYKQTSSPLVLFAAAVLTAVGCGFITGMITVKLRVPPFIASLCMQFACRGIVNPVLQGSTIGVTELSSPGWEIRLPVLAVIAIAVFVSLNFTMIGKYNKAIGENIKAAKSSCIDVDKYRVIAYLISGAAIGIAAYFDLLRNGVMSTNVGYGLEMNVIVAVVLGGLSLSGGYATSIRGAVLGGLLITIMTNGLMIVGVPITYSGIIQGAIFLALVTLTYKRDKNALLPR